MKIQQLYTKPKCLEHHKNRCLLQNERNHVSLNHFQTRLSGLKQHTRARNHLCGSAIYKLSIF